MTSTLLRNDDSLAHLLIAKNDAGMCRYRYPRTMASSQVSLRAGMVSLSLFLGPASSSNPNPLSLSSLPHRIPIVALN